MNAQESVAAGRPEDALAALKDEVRKHPADSRLRVFLFQLLAVTGQWDKALTQLKVAAELDPTTSAMLQTYQEALRCEVSRAEIFAGRRAPLVFGEPAEWMALMVHALELTAHGKFEEARNLRDKALEGAPVMPGRIDGQPFEWLADADSRLGPVLEAIVNGRYYWIPFSRLQEVRIEKPCDLRDIAWTPAHLTFENQGTAVALIPTRYPGSETAADARLVMSRGTEWIERPGSTFLGLGQRLLVTDQGEYGLMDVRLIEFGALDLPRAEEDGAVELERGTSA